MLRESYRDVETAACIMPSAAADDETCATVLTTTPPPAVGLGSWAVISSMGLRPS